MHEPSVIDDSFSESGVSDELAIIFKKWLLFLKLTLHSNVHSKYYFLSTLMYPGTQVPGYQGISTRYGYTSCIYAKRLPMQY